ncbi:MAG: hypothetical protein V4454_08100 [Pseudomonadota bacterium]
MSHLISKTQQHIQAARDWDKKRPGFPAEHWIVLGAGVAVMLASRRSTSPIVRALGAATGGALVARAASGRDGIAKLVALLPSGTGLIGRRQKLLPF